MADTDTAALPQVLADAAAPEAVVHALLGLAAAEGAGLALKDAASGRLLWVDEAYAAAWGRSAAELAGRVETELFDEGLRAAVRDAEAQLASLGAAFVAMHRVESGGRRREMQVARARIDGAGGRALVLARWLDVSAGRETEQRLQAALAQIEAHQAAEAARPDPAEAPLRDQVTGLYQRAQFDDLLRREVDLSLREHREFALAAIEIDPPDAEIAALGPIAEQRVLEAVGRLLRGNTRAMDASCRFDGRRFAVLLSGVGLATAHSRMEGMRRQCATQIVVLDGRNLGFTVSMGVASFPHTAHTQDELVHAAQAALAEAKRRGGNQVTLASIRFEPVP